VIIYKECQYTVLPSYIDIHFTAKPQHRLEKKEQQRIADTVTEIDRLIDNEKTLRRCKFLFPLSTSKPITALAEPKRDRIQCTNTTNSRVCRYIYCSI
jgi:hypothetical protein